MSPKQGEVWLADLGFAAKTRPVIIISRTDPEPPRALIIYIPLTTKYRGSRYEVELGELPFLHEISWANLQGIAALPLHRLEQKLGQLSSEAVTKIKHALFFTFDL